MIGWFARHPTAANLLMAVFVLLGASSLPGLERETFPDFTPEEIEVRVPYPGAGAEDVEQAICLRVEDAADAIADVAELRCEAREGVATAVARMVEDGDIARFLDDVKTEIEAITTFPDDAEAPVIRQLGRTDRVVSVAVTGPMPATDLKAYCERLKDRLQALPQVSQVTIEGFSERQLRVALSAPALRQYGLGVREVADAIARQSVDLPAGSMDVSEREILVRFADQRQGVRALEDLVVMGTASGAELRLAEVAEVTDRFEDEEVRTLFDGRRAGVLRVTKTKAEDTLRVVAAVQDFVAGERRRAPPGVSFALTQDLSSIVQDRLQMLLRNGAQGLVLVFGTLWVFFHLRLAFWVAMGLPVAFLGGLFFMSLFGYSINMITMVGLLIALGLLMDDAIVISENIATRLRAGRTALQAAIEGTRQVAPGVLSSFLTTTAVFGPLAFLQGDIGAVLKVLPVVLILVLAVSLAEAFWILPHHLAHALEQQPSGGRFRVAFDRRLEWLRHRALGRAVDAAVGQRYLFAGGVLALFIVTAGVVAGGHLKFVAFPEIDGDVIEARILLPQGTPLARTEAVVNWVRLGLERVDARYRLRQPEGERLVRHVSVHFGENADAGERGPHVATVAADLLTAERRNGRLDEIMTRWREEVGTVPDAIAINFKEPQLGPGGRPIDVELAGPDLEALKAASVELQRWLASYRGVQDLGDDLRPGKPELRLRLREGALALGLDAAGVAGQLRAAFQGTTADEIQVGAESYEIDVRISGVDDLVALEDLQVTAPGGAPVPLSEVAVIEAARGYARINRVDGRRTVNLTGDVDARVANVNEILQDTRQRWLPGHQARHPEVRVSFGGQAEEGATTGASMGRGFLIGLAAIFLLLSLQFRSYAEPLIVMLAIPLALIGVVWGHLLMGLDLSMPSMMGFVSLAGIVVNDSILLVEFLKLRAREGLTVPEAARQASRDRFRAVLLTSLTTIAGLLPLLAERSLQAQVLVPLVASIAFGLVATTLLVLLVVPALYAILDDLGRSTLSEGMGSPEAAA